MKRSKSLQTAIDQLNEILASPIVVIEQESTEAVNLIHVTSINPRAQLFKQGIVEALEILLHKSKTYKGYCFLDPNDPSRKFDRKYF